MQIIENDQRSNRINLFENLEEEKKHSASRLAIIGVHSTDKAVINETNYWKDIAMVTEMITWECIFLQYQVIVGSLMVQFLNFFFK